MRNDGREGEAAVTTAVGPVTKAEPSAHNVSITGLGAVGEVVGRGVLWN